MKMKTVSGAAIATAAAGLILSGAVMTPAAAGAAASEGKCMGVNACKGQGTCKTLFNQCKGQNACKGRGFSMMSKAECTKSGGKFSKA